ncbi:hypothetical protein V6N13_012462 [Hibiscus sabdariffa]
MVEAFYSVNRLNADKHFVFTANLQEVGKHVAEQKELQILSKEKLLIQSETTKAKLPSSSSEHRMAFRLGGKEVQAPLWIWKVLLPVRFIKRGKNYWKKVKVDEIMNNLSNDFGEACGSIDGRITDSVQGKIDMEISSAKNKYSQRKKSKKIISGGRSLIWVITDKLTLDPYISAFFGDPLTLTRELQRGSSPQFSQKPYNKVECRKSTLVQSHDRM